MNGICFDGKSTHCPGLSVIDMELSGRRGDSLRAVQDFLFPDMRERCRSVNSAQFLQWPAKAAFVFVWWPAVIFHGSKSVLL